MKTSTFARNSFTLALVLAGAYAHAQIRWVPSSGGPWSTAANWNGGQPNAGTGALDVYIDYAPFTVTGGIGSFTTTLNYGANISRLFSRANFTITAPGSLAMAQAGSIIDGAFTMQGGSLSTPGLTVNGLFDLSSANFKQLTTSTISAMGPASFANTIRNTNGTLNLGGVTTLADGVFQDGVVNVLSSATLTKNAGAGSFTLNQVWNGGSNAFNNAGTVNSTSGTIIVISNGTHTGVFKGTGGSVNFASGSHTLNTGTSLQTGVTIAGAALTVPTGQQLNITGSPTWTSGTVAGAGTIVGSGTLSTNGGSPGLGGTLTNNAVLRINGPLFAVNSTLTNNGTLLIEGGSTYRDGIVINNGLLRKDSAGDAAIPSAWNGGPQAVINNGTLRSAAGNLRITGAATHAGIVEGTGGIVTLESGAHTVAPGNAFRNGVELNGSALNIPQGGTLNIEQNPVFRVGSVNAGGTGATIAGAGELQVVAPTGISFAGVHNSQVNTNYVNGVFFNVNSTFNNSAQLRIQSGLWRDGILNNSGTIRKQSAGNADLNTPWNGGPTAFNNSGSLIVEGGLLRILGNGTHTGSFNGQGGTVRFENTTHSFRNGSSLTGNIRFQSAALNVPAAHAVSVSNAVFENSSLNGAGTLAGPGLITLITNNIMQGATLTSTGTMRLVNSPLSLVNSNITNDGTLELDGTSALADIRDGILRNRGTIRSTGGTARLNVSFNGGPTQLLNQGLIVANPGTTLRVMNNGLHSGTFRSEAGALVSFDGGTHTLESGTILEGLTATNTAMVCNQSVDIFGISDFNTGTWSGTGNVLGDTWRWTTGSTKFLAGNLKASANIVHDMGAASFVNSTFTNRGTATISDGLPWRDGIIINEGTIQKLAGAGTVTLSEQFNGGPRSVTNTGRLSAQSGTLQVVAPLTNFSAGTLSGGTYEATGTARLWLPTAQVGTLAARVIRRSSGAVTTSNGTTPLLLDDLALLGGLELTNGATETFDDLVVSGDLFVGTGSSITKTVGASPAVLQNGGLIRMNGTLANGLVRSAGNLSGVGQLETVTSTGGSISPGDPIGALTCTSAALTNTTFSVKVRNATAGNFSRLAATGTVQLNAGNTLAADAAPNSTVTAGTVVDVITTTNRTGTFATVPPATDWTVAYGPTFVRLTAQRNITGPVLIEGQMDLNGFDASYTTAPILAELKQGGVTVETPTITLRPDKTYAIETRRRGSFDLVLSGGTWLNRQIFPAVFLSDAGINNLNILMKNGDVNGDNEVGPGDFSLIALAFGSFLGDSNYNPNADLNKDDEVGPRDFAILAANFGEFGD